MATASTGVTTTWVTGGPCSARARSTTSNLCQTEYSGGSVAITIWSGLNCVDGLGQGAKRSLIAQCAVGFEMV